MTPLKTMIAPATSTRNPSQSLRDHDARCARARSLDHTMKSKARRNVTGIIESSPRTNGATAEARTAPPIQARERVTSAFAIKKKQNAAYGYASVSSTIHEEYAIEGMTAAPVAASSAALRPTTR